MRVYIGVEIGVEVSQIKNRTINYTNYTIHGHSPKGLYILPYICSSVFIIAALFTILRNEISLEAQEQINR